MRQRRPKSSQFGAPWALKLKITTIILLVLAFDICVIPPFVLPVKAVREALPALAILPLILGGIALFCVRGYSVRHRELWIQRSFWQTRLPLKGLHQAYADPDAMKKVFRTCGSAGFMAFLGWYRSKRMGSFRAWVTDPTRCVVLEFADRKIVVSPDDPAGLVHALGFEPATVKDAE